MMVTATNCVWANPSVKTVNTASSQSGVQDQKLRLLFAFKVKHAVLQAKGSTGEYTLTIPVNNIASVNAMSDRPNRVAYQLKPDDYAKLIHQGNNNFDVDPPNIIISFANVGELITAQITSFKRGSDVLTWGLKPLLPISEKNYAGAATVFIDEYPCDSLTNCYKVE